MQVLKRMRGSYAPKCQERQTRGERAGVAVSAEQLAGRLTLNFLFHALWYLLNFS